MEQIAYVNGSFVPLSEARSRSWTAASCLRTASTRSPPCWTASWSTTRRIWRGWSVRSARSSWRCRKRRAHPGNPEGTGHAQQSRQRHGLPGSDARRRYRARLRVSQGRQADADHVHSVKDIINAPSAKTGINVITVPDLRWTRRDIKRVALLAQVLAKQAAAVAGAGEAWMIEDGKVTEGGSSSASS